MGSIVPCAVRAAQGKRLNGRDRGDLSALDAYLYFAFCTVSEPAFARRMQLSYSSILLMCSHSLRCVVGGVLQALSKADSAQARSNSFVIVLVLILGE
jgi:hypothetical protein